MARNVASTLLLLDLMLVPVVLFGQAGGQTLDVPMVAEPSQGAWDARQLQESAAYWRTAAASGQPGEAILQYNLFRSERNLALQRGKGRPSDADIERLEAIAADLHRTGQSPEKDLAQFHLDMPTPSGTILETLARFAELQPDRTDLYGPLLIGAVLHGDENKCKAWTARIKDLGGIAPPLLEMADDLLLSTSPDAILFTAGEMDSHALWVRQFVDGQRRDVQVLDMRLLEDPSYRALQWGLHGGKGPVPQSADEFLERFVGLRQDRPVHLSLALGSERMAPFKSKLYLRGLSVQYSNVALDNMKQLEQGWAQMRKPATAGPLSRNYLPVGSVLLKHYRAVGNESGSAAMEHELRQMAGRMNAIDELYRLGILEH